MKIFGLVVGSVEALEGSMAARVCHLFGALIVYRARLPYKWMEIYL